LERNIKNRINALVLACFDCSEDDKPGTPHYQETQILFSFKSVEVYAVNLLEYPFASHKDAMNDH
jgi:hypothetical protein